MRFRRGAELDAGQVQDRRGMGVGLPLVGGGGLLGIIVLVLSALGGVPIPGGGGGGSGLAVGGESGDLSQECRTGADAEQRDDCRIVAVVNSVQAHWVEHYPGYQKAPTVFFSGATTTGCGQASSAVGPFYCPTDQTVYIDLTFYDELRQRFGAKGGPFAEAYVIAHEYGHHVQDLMEVLERSRQGGTGANSGAVRVELMADCLAGVWAGNATGTGFIEELTEADVRDGLDAAAAIGDDRLQRESGGDVDPESWTHGSSEQRQRWFLTGFRGRAAERCDTFATDQL